jgi:hypothetical protein
MQFLSDRSRLEVPTLMTTVICGSVSAWGHRQMRRYAYPSGRGGGPGNTVHALSGHLLLSALQGGGASLSRSTSVQLARAPNEHVCMRRSHPNARSTCCALMSRVFATLRGLWREFADFGKAVRCGSRSV